MDIPIPQDDPKAKVVVLKPSRKPTMEITPKDYAACRHERVFITEEKRMVKCQSCKTILDAFTVLVELARRERRWLQELDAWDAYRESKLAERYDKTWERYANDVTTPPEDPELRRIWNTFERHLGGKFTAMFRRKKGLKRGPEWYARTQTGGCFSYEFVRNQLMPKVGVGAR